jgi:tetratricopeptide (TPR) repeat protein
MTKRGLQTVLVALMVISCSGKKNQDQLQSELSTLNLKRGEITLCGAGEGQFGAVSFDNSCSEKVSQDFNVAVALLHSFEYADAEKVFAKVIAADPQCVFAYWGAAMCNFHPMWEAPNQADLEKGLRIIKLARSLINDRSSRESDYIEAIATIYDNWDSLNHRARLAKFEKASAKVFEKYPDDSEAAIFYSLALIAAADPTDKSFHNQKKAGGILNAIFVKQPNHPGIAHYIIHNFDYPELAELALPTARKYAAIAPASAHAQHMPSHIFIRLGLWDESIQSDLRSASAAQCYAQSMEMKGHWDEELHALDYLTYAYLQRGDDKKALEQIEYLNKINDVSPKNFKVAYSFAAQPVRFALERRNWADALKLELRSDFPWEKFPWEKANINFGRLLGAVHSNKIAEAKNELKTLEKIHQQLTQAKDGYKANLILIQIKTSNAWIKLAEGRKDDAIFLMTEAADLEEATAKHPVTPGEVLPARELLADMYLQLNQPARALDAYELDLKSHPNRFNGLYGAGLAAEKLGDKKKASGYYRQLISITTSDNTRQELAAAQKFVAKNN